MILLDEENEHKSDNILYYGSYKDEFFGDIDVYLITDKEDIKF